MSKNTVIIEKQGIVNQTISTDGFLVIYINEDKINFAGEIDLKSLTPMLTKLVLERLVK